MASKSTTGGSTSSSSSSSSGLSALTLTGSSSDAIDAHFQSIAILGTTTNATTNGSLVVAGKSKLNGQTTVTGGLVTDTLSVSSNSAVIHGAANLTLPTTTCNIVGDTTTNTLTNKTLGTTTFTGFINSSIPLSSTTTCFGTGACAASTGAGLYNSAFGAGSLGANYGGSSYNTAFGYQAMNAYTNTAGSNTIIGCWAQAAGQGQNNTAVGYQSLRYASGTFNTAIGLNSGFNNPMSGLYNTFVGHSSGTGCSTQSKCTFLGATSNMGSGANIQSTAIGYGATITAPNQICCGTATEYVYIPSTIASSSTATGGLVLTGGAGIGGALFVGGGTNITGGLVTDTLTTGSISITAGELVLPQIGQNNANHNTQFGTGSLGLSTSASSNCTAIGNSALASLNNAAANNCTAVGSLALKLNTAGDSCTAVGVSSLGNTPGSNNTAVGCASLGTIGDTSCTNNTGIGYLAGNSSSIHTDNCTFLGANTACASNSNRTYSTAVGASAIITSNNQIVLGTATEYVSIPGTKAATSTSSAGLVVAGGCGIGGKMYIGGGASLVGGTTVDVLTTNGIVYESTAAVTTSASNVYSISYTNGGVFYIPSAYPITSATCTLSITNIPTDTTKSYSFSVVAALASGVAHNYINAINVLDTTGSTYILGSAGTYVGPMWAGGPPASPYSSNTAACLMIHQYTVFSIGTTRYVTCSISPCNAT